MDIEIKCPDEAILCGRRIIKGMQQVKNDGKHDSNTAGTTSVPYQELANDYGIDLETTVDLVEWIHTLFRNGTLEAKQVKPLFPDADNVDSIPHGIQCIAGRKGLCDILAEGPVTAAESIGGNSLQYYKKGNSKTHADNDLKTVKDTTAQVYTDRALGCLGVPQQYSWLLQPKQPVHKDFIQLIQLNTGLNISSRKLKEVAKRSVAVEQEYNLREDVTRGSEAVNGSSA